MSNVVKEIDIVNAIIKYLNYQGFYIFRVNAGMMFTKGKVFRGAPAGVSDIIGITPQGKFIALEVKLPKRKNNVTLPQRQFLDTIIKKGGIGDVVDSIEDVKRYIKQTR